MNRRVFLGAMTATLAAARSTFAEASHQLDRIGLQLYTVRDQMKADMAGTLAQVAKAGYNDVEFAGYFEHSPKQVRELLDRNNLRAPAAHLDLAMLSGDQLPKTIEMAHTIGHELLVCPWIDEAARATPAGWEKMADAFNKAGEAAKKAGLRFAYHNHSFEFAGPAGKPYYDILLAKTDPALVSFEADLFWMTFAGANPLAYLEKHPKRFVSVHIKDMSKSLTLRSSDEKEMGKGDAAQVDVGQGSMDWGKILAAAKRHGVKYYFVEQDNAKDPIAMITNSQRYLRGLKF
jgi:sugar phosphate isomerase/epimerase